MIRQYLYSVVSSILLLLLLPYLCTFAMAGAETAFAIRRPDLESCIPVLLQTQIDDVYEQETICAQAVIARTNLYRRARDGDALFTEEQTEGRGSCDLIKAFKDCRKLDPYIAAVRDTEGMALVRKGKLQLVPYHEISAGKTRSGKEVLRGRGYAYLQSVDSSADREAPGYINKIYISSRQLPQEIRILERDSAGYVMKLSADGMVLEGEAFCRGSGLPSSHFIIGRNGENYCFTCHGKGHGLGFSQYGGNEMAKNNYSWKNILKAYFPKMKVKDIRDENLKTGV